jgi:hypothetical protein
MFVRASPMVDEEDTQIVEVGPTEFQVQFDFFAEQHGVRMAEFIMAGPRDSVKALPDDGQGV